jgi:hypothetical protein
MPGVPKALHSSSRANIRFIPFNHPLVLIPVLQYIILLREVNIPLPIRTLRKPFKLDPILLPLFGILVVISFYYMRNCLSPSRLLVAVRFGVSIFHDVVGRVYPIFHRTAVFLSPDFVDAELDGVSSNIDFISGVNAVISVVILIDVFAVVVFVLVLVLVFISVFVLAFVHESNVFFDHSPVQAQVRTVGIRAEILNGIHGGRRCWSVIVFLHAELKEFPREGSVYR